MEIKNKVKRTKTGDECVLDLFDTNWIYVGNAWETATNALDAAFDSVINELPISGIYQGFIQLEIREN